jgi:hypothetical protein
MTIRAQILEFPDWRVFQRRFKAASDERRKAGTQQAVPANVHPPFPKARFRLRYRNSE